MQTPQLFIGVRRRCSRMERNAPALSRFVRTLHGYQLHQRSVKWAAFLFHCYYCGEQRMPSGWRTRRRLTANSLLALQDDDGMC